MTIVDVDNPESWPLQLRAEAEALAADLRGTTEYVGDLELPDGCDERFRELLVGSQLMAYHATRLLPHELASIRRQGLRLLTPELVSDRIRDAHAGGFISEAQRELLEGGTVFSKDPAANRRDRICFFLSEETFKNQAGLWRLLSTWGGEAIYWEHDERSDLVADLRRLGTPAIVVAGLRHLEEGWRAHAVWPELPKHFVGTLLDLQSRGADVHYGRPVPHRDIIDIWVPGDAPFDGRLAWLAS